MSVHEGPSSTGSGAGGRQPEVVVYGSPGCEETRRAQRRLEEAGVEYRRVEVAALDNPVRTLRDLVGDLIETPIVAVGEQARIGLDMNWLRERLAERPDPADHRDPPAPR